MPQKKPVVVRNTRHVDGIKEMIDIVRHQQAPPVMRKVSESEFSLKRRNPLPGITTSSGGSEASPRSGAADIRWQDVSNSIDTETPDNDVDFDYDNNYDVEDDADDDPELMQGRQTPNQLIRSGSFLSTKSSHVIGLSRSLDTATLSRQMAAGRRISLHDLDHSALNRSVRNLPPVRRKSNSKRRSRPPAPVPHLDLSRVIALTPDDEEDEEGEEDYERSAYSPDPTSSPLLRSNDDVFVAADGGDDR